MIEHNITWYFNLKKFRKFHNYKESLGYIKNCAWSIKVTKVFNRAIIHLEVSENVDSYEVSATITKYLETGCTCKEFYFDSKNKSREIYDCNLNTVSTRTNHPFTVFLTFKSRVINDEKSKLCHLNELSKDFESLLVEEHFSDVTIQCDSITLKAHKMVLCSRSPVLKAMLVSNMQKKTITIYDLDAEVLGSVIRFMYCGEVDVNSIPKAICLLDAADKYQIQSLKTGILEYFRSVVSEKNVFKVLELADWNDENLKADVLKFIGLHFNTLKESKEWNDFKFSQPTLALEVYSYVDNTKVVVPQKRSILRIVYKLFKFVFVYPLCALIIFSCIVQMGQILLSPPPKKSSPWF